MKVHKETLQVRTTGEFDVIDVTEDVEHAVISSEVAEGYAFVYSPHTTFAVLLNEKESGLLVDLFRVLARLVPESRGNLHDEDEVATEHRARYETPNAHAHIRHVLGGRSSEYVPVSGGALILGRWQRIMLVELDRPRDREVVIQICGN